MKTRSALQAGILVLTLLLTSCAQPAATPTLTPTETAIPAPTETPVSAPIDTPTSTPTPTTDWPISTPEEQGMDSAKLDEMVALIDELKLPIDSVIVARHGHIVLEEYPDPNYRPNSPHILYSVTKSVTSILIGIAIQEGFIESVDQKVVDLFPERTIKNLDSRKRKLTLEHLLTMTSGFEWEGPDDGYHTWQAAISSGDPVQFILDRPMANDPGAVWYYNGGCSHLLSAIITETTGRSTLEFAREFLFGPLGISRLSWPKGPRGIYLGGQDIWLQPRDLAKLGQLCLNDGTWEGEQIVPAAWVAGSGETSVSNTEYIGYGYQWWIFPKSGVYYANGAYGQKLYVVPDLDLVVVFTALKLGSHDAIEGGLLHRYVLPACGVPWERATCSRYGFSFDCSIAVYGFNFDWTTGTWSEAGTYELGLGEDGTVDFGGTISATDRSGLITFGDWYGGMGVMWSATETAPRPEDVMEKLWEALIEADARSKGVSYHVDKGATVTTKQAGHEILYGHHIVTYDPDKAEPAVVHDVTAAWHCDATGRAFMAFLGTSAEQMPASGDEALVSRLQSFIDTFVCH